MLYAIATGQIIAIMHPFLCRRKVVTSEAVADKSTNHTIPRLHGVARAIKTLLALSPVFCCLVLLLLQLIAFSNRWTDAAAAADDDDDDDVT